MIRSISLFLAHEKFTAVNHISQNGRERFLFVHFEFSVLLFFDAEQIERVGKRQMGT